MDWTKLLQKKIEHTYKTTDNLMNLVDDDMLDWKPSPDNNWMTVAQLLMHICISCGAPMRGIVTGDWGLPDDMDINDLTPEQIELVTPDAEKMPTVESVAFARQFLAEDKQIALETLGSCSEEELAEKPTPVPWDSGETVLGHLLLDMVAHLSHHKAQLFYYLKLQGKPVNTVHLCGA
ncbi:DinB family protein [Candidatus Latescibacterota bacterium]